MAANTITTDDGFVYRLTESDLDWSSRMLANEGGAQAADLWTLAQRFVLLHRSFPTFAAMLRAFSQPINPRWLADGEFCKPGGRYYGTEHCSADKLAHRAHAQDPATQYPTARAFVDSWAQGAVPNPVPRAVDFRMCDDTAATLVASGRASLVLSAGNCYVARDGSEDWSEDHVLVAGRGTSKSHVGAVLAVLAALALVAGGTYLYAEHAR